MQSNHQQMSQQYSQPQLPPMSQPSQYSQETRRPRTDRYQPMLQRHLEVNPANMSINVNPDLSNVQAAPFIMGKDLIQQIERNFEAELGRLKQEMQGQQRQFESQLRQLREEAQRNIDFRYKAERDLDQARDMTQRERMRPHMAELGQALSQQPTTVRRSMLLGEFEKMYFRKPERQEVGMGDPTRMSAQVPLDLLRKQKDQRNPGHATIIMPINFEGSTSLKAESVFVSMNP